MMASSTELPAPTPPPHLVKAFNRDLALFSNNPDRHRALVFPAVNSYSRLCLHLLIKQNYPELVSFSVGTEKERRPVVCHQMTVAERTLEMIKVNPLSENGTAPQSQFLSRENESSRSSSSDDTKSSDSVNEEQKISSSKRNRRRPDRAVYVPPRSNKEARKLPDSNKTEPVKNRVDNCNQLSCFNSFAPTDPLYLMEIYAILGFVKLVGPLNDYLAIESGCLTKDDIIENDLPNVVEMYEFPQEFKTDDLELCLHNNLKLIHYYDLKWVDDTHALAIFTDVVTANKALTITDPCIKFRPFWSASPQSVTKARMLKLTTESTASRCRPKTSSDTAKRLLARALGMPSINAPKPTEHNQRGSPRSK